MKKLLLIFILSLAVGSLTLTAKVSLPPVLSSHMVFQRNAQCRLLGQAKPHSIVEVSCSWLEQAVSVKAKASGAWEVKVPTGDAGGPYIIVVKDEESSVELSDVLLGDVWFCSGQSNMEMPMQGFPNQPVEGALEEIMMAGRLRNLRMFTCGKNIQENVGVGNSYKGEWLQANSASVASCSAVAYFFAKALGTALDVPIGIIVSAYGGTSILSWMPEINTDSVLNPEEKRAMIASEPHPKPLGSLFNGMVHPFVGLAIKGFVWYQGEANITFPKEYERLMDELVHCWRDYWGDKKAMLPFYFVQIAPYKYSGVGEIERPIFVDSQKHLAATIKNAYMATTTDFGVSYCIHPPAKKPIGERLAALALVHTYGYDGFEADYPRLKSVKYEGGKAVLSFDSPLCVGPAKILGFEVAGENKVFYPAKALVDRRACVVNVSSDYVPNPVAVRYAYKNAVEANMVNSMGVALPSFRTDSW